MTVMTYDILSTIPPNDQGGAILLISYSLHSPGGLIAFRTTSASVYCSNLSVHSANRNGVVQFVVLFLPVRSEGCIVHARESV